MDSKFNIDNFERFLKEKTDEFRIYPSKRVWYGIYNSMHPGSRLPSISMCIVLIFSLLLIGYLNTDTSKHLSNHQDNPAVALTFTSKLIIDPFSPFNNYGLNPGVQLSVQQVATKKYAPVKDLSTAGIPAKPVTVNNNNVYAAIKRTRSNNNINSSNEFNSGKPGIASAHNDEPSLLVTAEANLSIINTATATNVITGKTTINNTTALQESTGENNSILPENIQPAWMKNNAEGKNKNAVQADITAVMLSNEAHTATDNNKQLAETKTEKYQAAAFSETDKAWVEDFALHNKPVAKKWAGKLSWQAYITPSVVYRSLYNNAAGKSPEANAGSINNTDVDLLVDHKPSFGIETGIALQYDVLKRVKVKMGVQLNYTRYNAHAFDNYHPTSTSLTMISENNQFTYEVFTTTPFSNSTGLTPVKLHNETYQFSIPVGADFKLATFDDNLEWYIGATIQPTVVVYGRSYLISTDRRNYAQDPLLLNRFNLNAGFETYISYKTKSYTWQFGPEFRSQIFSTNSKTYSVEERLQNYGFKIGITKKL